ncbi:MAG: S16 family serine protease [archaeon]
MRRWLVLIILLALMPLAQAQEIGTAEISVPAVSINGTGVMTSLEVEIIEGKGRVLLSAEPLTGLQTQNSERIATAIAEEKTNVDFSKVDVIYMFFIQDANAIEGPSAGAAMTVATIAAAENKEVRKDASITGTIQSDGTIGEVGGVIEKAQAAAEAGHNYFLIPYGTELQPYFVEKVEHPAPGWTTTSIEIEYRNITKYAAEEWGLTIIQVQDIDDAVEIMLEGKNYTTAKLPKLEDALSEFLTVSISEELEPMKQLAADSLDKAAVDLNEANEVFAEYNVNPDLQEMLAIILGNAEDELALGKKALMKGHLYGAANHGFRASVDAKFVRDSILYRAKGESERTKFLGERISEVDGLLTSTQDKFSDAEKLLSDTGAFEWALGAEERLAQAEEELSEKANESSEILYSLEIAEAWILIADDFYDIAQDQTSGEHKDLGVFENLSIEKMQKLNAELGQFPSEGAYGPEWRYSVAVRMYEKGWYTASYVTASSAINRLETSREFNFRSKEGIVNYVEREIGSVEKTSIWGSMYLDYAELLTYYAKEDQSLVQLNNALIYARSAEVYNEASVIASEAPDKFVADNNDFELVVVVISLFVVAFALRLRRSKRNFKRN